MVRLKGKITLVYTKICGIECKIGFIIFGCMDQTEPVDTVAYTRELILDIYKSNLKITYGDDVASLFTDVVAIVQDKNPPGYEIPIRLSWIITVVISHALATYPADQIDSQDIVNHAHNIYHQ